MIFTNSSLPTCPLREEKSFSQRAFSIYMDIRKLQDKAKTSYKSVSEIEEQGKELEDILKKLDELQKKNTVLLRKYNGDAKFARVHKRIREENLARKAANKQPIVSEYDMSIMNVLLSIKFDIDQKVYDRNDILKKDAYFERTVMTQIKAGIDKLGIASAREDRVFIQSRITKQYLDQYNQTYSVA